MMGTGQEVDGFASVAVRSLFGGRLLDTPGCPRLVWP